MIERRPDYEDEKMRAWTFGAADRRYEEFEGDPTVMRLEVEREEIFESRTYRFQPRPEVLLYLFDVATDLLSEQGVSDDEIIPFAVELFLMSLNS